MLHVRQRSATHGFAYDVRDDAGGVVEEPRRLTWVREFRVDLPGTLERDRQLFFAVMALHDLT